jgi:3'-phosphoadenosine 5'-phosphosulfate sulfotransferase (PAPS reductase)/FAD synthetase
MNELELSTIALDAVLTAPEWLKLYDNILVSISGGSDSDILLDIINRSAEDKSKIHYVFFDTGIEYEATKKHLTELEEKYGVSIERLRAEKPVPYVANHYGQPFLSKYVSEMLSRLQRHNFDWSDDSFENLIKRFPNCDSALKWWCNERGEGSKFNINRNKYLKEFIMENPPTFKISNKCCHFAKKALSAKYERENNINLKIYGVRKAEGGVRVSAYKSCFTDKGDMAEYRPMWWFTNEDKENYEKVCGITHSECYTKYGLKRTGCAGCPLGRDFTKELEIIQEHEPKLYAAVMKIFGDSYSYTLAYRDYVKRRKEA